MSNTQQLFNSGKARGEGAAKADQWVQSGKDTANSMSDSTQQNKEQAAGFLQQTGEQVKQMAQGAADAVKSAVGMGNTPDTAGSTTTSTTTTTSKH